MLWYLIVPGEKLMMDFHCSFDRHQWRCIHHFLHFLLNIFVSHKKKFHWSAQVPQLVEHGLCIGDISSMLHNFVSWSLKGTPYTIWSPLSMVGLKEVPADVFEAFLERLFWQNIKVVLLFVLGSRAIAEDMEATDQRVSLPHHVYHRVEVGPDSWGIVPSWGWDGAESHWRQFSCSVNQSINLCL